MFDQLTSSSEAPPPGTSYARIVNLNSSPPDYRFGVELAGEELNVTLDALKMFIEKWEADGDGSQNDDYDIAKALHEKLTEVSALEAEATGPDFVYMDEEE